LFKGEPADNAAQFVNWLKNLKESELAGVRFAVFGCGNHDWVQTFQRIPKLCDDLSEQRGGKRLVPRGVGDAGQGDFFQVFDEFEANLWKTLCDVYLFYVPLRALSDRTADCRNMIPQSPVPPLRDSKSSQLILELSGPQHSASQTQLWVVLSRTEF
jgi:hypothetical protein